MMRFEPGQSVWRAWSMAVAWMVLACGAAAAQAVEAGAVETGHDGCQQTVLYPMASSSAGAIALLASVTGASPTHVGLTIGLRYEQPLFGLENFVKHQMPNAVAFVVGAEQGRVRLGPSNAMTEVAIRDLGYLPNTGTEFITVDVPLDVFRSWLHPPRAVSGRVDTRRYVLEFEFPAPFFDALASGFTSICLAGTAAVVEGVPATATVAGATPATDEAIPIEGNLPMESVDLRTSPLLFIEDVRHPDGPVLFIERERRPWLGFTIVEVSPAEEDLAWFGWVGGGFMIVLDHAGNALSREPAPYRFGLRDVTGDGADELVVDHDASGASGCCDGISVFAQQAGSLQRLFSVFVFGSVGLMDLDGDGVHEVVGDARLGSSTLPNVARVQVPFVCAWDGTRILDVTAGLGASYVDEWMAQRRGRITSPSDGEAARQASAAARELVAAALLFGMPAALDELQWIEGSVGTAFAREAMTDLDDFSENLMGHEPCR